MKIVGATLAGIKCFSRDTFFGFSGDSSIHAISGRNGSGKTAVFKSIQLFQKIFFFDALGSAEKSIYRSYIDRSIESLLSSDQARIALDFEFNAKRYSVCLNIAIDSEVDYQFGDSDNGVSIGVLRNFWNPQAPKAIVVFIDANKSFSDFSVGFDNLSLKPRSVREREFLIDCIFNPEDALRAIYRRTVLDHIHYRLDPSRTYDYFKRANEAVRKVVENIEVKNISSTKIDGQFVMLGRTRSDVWLFDVKDFSSGERALYLSLLFLFYVKDIGILIVDEPENHFHEEMLTSFYEFLSDVLEKGNLDAWYDGIKQQETNLQQVFLITHSKLLIYRSIVDGKAYLIENSGSHEISSDNMEVTLRDIGISSVLSRKVFVEGKGDLIFLSTILASYGIEVVPLGDCKEVVDHFKKISTVSDSMFSASFCFVVDRDNRPQSDFDEIRQVNSKFYDNSFLVLERHEIESYLIDSKLIRDAANELLALMEMDSKTESEINSLISSTAENLKEHSLSKYIASRLRSFAKKELLDVVSDSKRIRAIGEEDLIKKVLKIDLQSKLLDCAARARSEFESEWSSDWKKVVDGKAFLGRFLSDAKDEFGGMNQKDIKKIMIKKIRQGDYVMSGLVSDILEKFNLQK